MQVLNGIISIFIIRRMSCLYLACIFRCKIRGSPLLVVHQVLFAFYSDLHSILTILGAGERCVAADKDDCSFVFTYRKSNATENIELLVQKERSKRGCFH